MARAWLAVAILLTGCKSDGDGATKPGSGSETGSASATGVAKSGSSGFSAGLSADLAKQGSGGSGSAEPPKLELDAGTLDASASTALGSDAGPVAGKPIDAAATTSTVTASAPSDAPIAAKPLDAAASVATTADVKPRLPLKMSPELAAIKLSLLPNWERDVDEPGSISLFVKVPGRTESTMFVFRYGYEDPKAPSDRDAYIKWLADSKLLAVTTNRQRGAAWYLEGSDGGGPAFRFLVNFGGKHLICYGGLYKDSDSNRLGDIRDQVIIQAKQICETLAL